MGECEKLLCAQEKRYIRKELSSWYKKVPYAIGLEMVAENLAGNASGHIKTLLLPFNDMEPIEVADFNGPSDLPCCVCEGEDPRPEQENIPITPFYSAEGSEKTAPTHRDKQRLYTSRQGDTATASAEAKIGSASTSSAAELTTLEGLNSFYNQLAMTSMIYQQQQIQSAAVQAAFQVDSSPRQHSSAASSNIAAISGGRHPSEVSLDRQLLRCQEPQSAAAASEPSAAGLKVPEIHSNRKKKDNFQKRSYTERELKAAVDAIRNRTLGTRKAAQMYGVPRSTLRNKMLKETEMSRQLPDGNLQLNRASASLDDSHETQHSDTESPPPGSKQTSPHSRKRIDNQQADIAASMQHSAFLKQLEEMRNKQGLNDQMNLLNHQNRLLGDMFNPLQFAASYPFFMPQYSALAGMPSLDFMNPYASSLMMPYLPELVKNFQAHQQQPERPSAQLINGNAANHLKSPKNLSARTTTAKSEKDDIKIPAYKPSASNHSIDELAAQLPMLSKSAQPVTSEDNIEPSVHHPPSFSAVNYLQSIVPRNEAAGSKRSSPSGSHTPNKKYCLDQSLDSSQHSRPTNGNSSGKKRPKRGQYRKYDSELLAQAVRAVQRGEMSVHRAGTFFGVPHSTLEYKVKERHLLRKKKIAESNENKSSSPSLSVKEEPSSSKPAIPSDSASDSSQYESKTSPPTPPQLAIDESRSATEGNNPPALFDFSSVYNINTPASELLRKLHARAHQKANEIINGAKHAQESNS